MDLGGLAFEGCPVRWFLYTSALVMHSEKFFGGHPRFLSGIVAGCAAWVALPVVPPACLVREARRYCASELAVHACACGCVLCWEDAGGASPVVVCSVSCFVNVCCYSQCAFFVAATLCCGCLCATSDASSALCLVLFCTTAPLDVSNPLNRMAKQHHHENLSQHGLQCSLFIR